ncbi:hypothetical protein IB67_10260 [Fervidobacterium riparium]|nr:hypothetical protein IB67_10260 [Fervidobacterium riparium]
MTFPLQGFFVKIPIVIFNTFLTKNPTFQFLHILYLLKVLFQIHANLSYGSFGKCIQAFQTLKVICNNGTNNIQGW